MTRVVDTLIIEGEDVKGLCTPGWVPDKNSLLKASEYMANLKPTSTDKVILDL